MLYPGAGPRSRGGSRTPLGVRGSTGEACASRGNCKQSVSAVEDHEYAGADHDCAHQDNGTRTKELGHFVTP